MKSLIRGLLTIFLLVATLPAFSETLIGVPSCGSFVRDRAERSKNYVPQASWIVGYLSGAANATRQDFLANADVESIMLWIENYCRANPLKLTADAADMLKIELIKNSRR